MTIDDVIAVLARVQPDGFSLDEAFDELRAAGLGMQYSYDHGTSLHDQVWEHPMVTEHNSRLGKADILGSCFFTLYALQAEHYDLKCARYKLIIGRIGNTNIREFDLTPVTTP